VHYLRLYLGLAHEHSLPPYGPDSGDIAGDLTRICKRSTRALQSYKDGQKLFAEFVKKSQDGWLIEYSRFTRFELTCGGLRGKAMEDAISEKMPNRWWGHMDEREVLDRLGPTTYEQVETDIDDIEVLFDSAGIAISEFNLRLPEVFQMTKILLGLVFLEVGDCIVYACALIAEADELWTFDGYLKTIVGRIEDPSTAPERRAYYEGINRRVKDAVAKIISIDPTEVRLPKARKC
jgi:hypothetical protein